LSGAIKHARIVYCREAMVRPNPIRCACGHGANLHDRYGCAAFLGAFPETVNERRYCGCAVRSLDPLVLDEPDDERASFVAAVRVMARRGSAIAVCAFPAAIELGASVEDVLGRLKVRLRAVIPPAEDGPTQHIVILAGKPPFGSRWLEPL
jgi:hypothetical protein